MTTINLLPWRARRRELKRRAFAVGMAASITGAAVLLAVAWLRVEAESDKVRAANHGTAARLADLDDRLQAARELRDRIAAMDERIATVRGLHGARVNTVRVFDELAGTLAAGVRYTAVARRGREISVRGFAEVESSVSALLRNLDGSAQFGAPTLRNIADAGGQGTVAFDLTFDTTGAPGDRRTGTEPEATHEG